MWECLLEALEWVIVTADYMFATVLWNGVVVGFAWCEANAEKQMHWGEMGSVLSWNKGAEAAGGLHFTQVAIKR